jgi:YcaO cyclodehydratase, ATP-ad Mg2+-binding
MPIKVAAFGTAAQIYALHSQLPEILDEFGLSRSMRLSTYAAPSALLGHILVQAEHDGDKEGTTTVRAAGCGPDVGGTLRALAGELVERHLFASWRPERVCRASADELTRGGQLTLDVDRFIGTPIHPASWPHPPFDPGRHYDWTMGTTDSGRARIYIPAGLVSAADQFESGRFTELTSSGVAVGTSICDAEHRARNELLERDHLMRAWMGLLSLERLPPITDAPGWRTSLLHTRAGDQWFAVAVTVRSDDRPVGAIGAAVRPSLAAASKHALSEALMMRFAASFHDPPPAHGGQRLTFQTRTARYCSPSGVAALGEFVQACSAKPGTPISQPSPGSFVTVVMRAQYPVAVRVLASDLLAAESSPDSARVPATMALPDAAWHHAHPHPLG